MSDLLMRITTKENTRLNDDTIVEECMDRLMAIYPQVVGYQWERVDSDINILMWGDIDTEPIVNSQ